MKELNNIGVALTTERDLFKAWRFDSAKEPRNNMQQMLEVFILWKVKKKRESSLRFKITQNDSMKMDYEESVIPLTKESIAGYVASTGETLNIPDVYDIHSRSGIQIQPQF